MSEVLYRKYRARDFAEMQSQDVVVKVVKEGFLSGRFSHAYLFAGPRGTGKTSMARLVAKAANCPNFQDKGDVCNECEICKGVEAGNFLDMIEIDAASNRGIDEIRQIKENVNFSPGIGKHKVYIIDEVHMLTREAFNALLKTLEEPPEHVVFILATTEPHKVPPTILSRVQRFDFRLANLSEMSTKIQRILDTEKIQMEKEGINLLFQHSGGSYRDAESLLGKVISNAETGKITAADIAGVLGIADVQIISDFIDRLIAGEVQEALDLIDSVERDGTDLSQLSKQLIDYLRERIREEVEKGNDYRRYLKLLTKLVGAYSDFRHIDNPKLLLEIVALESSSNGRSSESAVKPSSKPLKQSQPRVVDSPNQPAVGKNEGKTKGQDGPSLSEVAGAEEVKPESPEKPEASEGATREADGVEDQSTNGKDKWKLVIKKAKQKDFKMMLLLRGCEPTIYSDRIVLSTNYGSAASELESAEGLLSLVNEYFPSVENIEIMINGDGNGTVVEEEKPKSNADLVESIF